MTTVDLVEIGPDDWQEFRRLRLRALSEAAFAFGSRYEDWVDAPEERWRGRLQDVPFNLVARAGREPVGMVSAHVEGDEVQLISMYVAGEARGTGLAQRLVERVVAWGAAQGRATFLMVRCDNAPAIAAYLRAGFVDEGVPIDWPEDEPRENRMVRRLGRAPRHG